VVLCSIAIVNPVGEVADGARKFVAIERETCYGSAIIELTFPGRPASHLGGQTFLDTDLSVLHDVRLPRSSSAGVNEGFEI
jgi:hypothetical protein